MNYQKIYDQLISRSSGRAKGAGVYYERHHIIPECLFLNRSRSGPPGDLLGDPDHPTNICLLTGREHLVAHLLLAKIYEGSAHELKIKSALVMFARVASSHSRQKNFKITSHEYERARRIGIHAISKSRKGTVPAIDCETGESVGSISTSHPFYLSGKWIHHSKGRVTCYNKITGIKSTIPTTEYHQNRDKWVSATKKSGCCEGVRNNNAKTPSDSFKWECISLALSVLYRRDDGTWGLPVNRFMAALNLFVARNTKWESVSETWIRNHFGGFGDICTVISKRFNCVVSPRTTNEKNYCVLPKSKWIWISDGVRRQQLKLGEEIPKGFSRGRK